MTQKKGWGRRWPDGSSCRIRRRRPLTTATTPIPTFVRRLRPLIDSATATRRLQDYAARRAGRQGRFRQGLRGRRNRRRTSASASRRTLAAERLPPGTDDTVKKQIVDGLAARVRRADREDHREPARRSCRRSRRTSAPAPPTPRKSLTEAEQRIKQFEDEIAKLTHGDAAARR